MWATWLGHYKYFGGIYYVPGIKPTSTCPQLELAEQFCMDSNRLKKWVSKNATGSSKLKGNISFRACQPNPLLMSVGVGFQERVKELRLHCSRWNQVSLCVHWQDLKRWKGSMASCHWRLKGCFWMPGTNPFRAPESLQCGELFHQGHGANFGPSIPQLFDPQQGVWVTPGQSPLSPFCLSFEQTYIDLFVAPHIHRLMSMCVIARISNCRYMGLSFYFITLLLMTLSRQA